LVEDLEDALGAGEGRLELVVELRDLVDRLPELARVTKEGGDDTDRRPAPDGHPATGTRDKREGEVVREVHHRTDAAGEGLGAGRRPAQGLVGRAELREPRAFLVIGLHDALAGDRLLD